MKKSFILLLVFLLIINISYAEITEKKVVKTGKQLGKDMIVNELIEQSNISNEIGASVKESNPALYNDIQNVCTKTSSARFWLGILTIASLIGLVTFPPAGIFLIMVTIFNYLNYICLI